MSSVMTDTTIDQTVSDEQAQGASTDASDNALFRTAEEQKRENEFNTARDKVVELAVATLDPKDMLKKYAKLGKEALSLANKRKESLAAGAWNGKEDFEKVCSDIEYIIRSRVAIKEIRIGTYVRIYLWVEAVKALCPDVEKLSYYQVANKLLPTLRFDAGDLTGEIRKEWLTWVRLTVDKQLSDEPLKVKELDASIDERKKEIVSEEKARSKKSPEEQLKAEQRAAEAKRIAERTSAQTKVLKSVADALDANNATMEDIAHVIGMAAKGADMDMGKVISKLVEGAECELPGKLVGLNPETITIDDCKVLASTMWNAGKIVEMKYLRDHLDRMIKIAENAMITSKTA